MSWCPQTLSWLGQSREDKMSSMRSSFGFGLKCLGNTPVLSLPYQEVSAFTSIKFSEMFLKEPGFSQTKYLQLLVAFSCSSAHKILSVWHVCKIFKSHEHELQPNNSFYGLLVCLCSSVCVFLWRCMTEQQAVCHSELSTDTQQCLYALALQPVRPVRRQTHTFTDLYDPLSPSRCYIKIPSQRYYTDFRHTCDKLWLGFCFVLFGELWLKCSKTMWHKVKQNCN